MLLALDIIREHIGLVGKEEELGMFDPKSRWIVPHIYFESIAGNKYKCFIII